MGARLTSRGTWLPVGGVPRPTLSPTVLSTVRRADSQMSQVSNFPSETLPLYHSNPTEKLLTENASPESTAGQWVGDGGHLSEQNPGLFPLRSGFLPEAGGVSSINPGLRGLPPAPYLLARPAPTPREHLATSREDHGVAVPGPRLASRPSSLSHLPRLRSRSGFCLTSRHGVTCEANLLEMVNKVSWRDQNAFADHRWPASRGRGCGDYGNDQCGECTSSGPQVEEME